MRVGFVCTNYNNASYTRAFVDSLAPAGQAGTAHVVLVDNGSRPDDLAAVQQVAEGLDWVEVVPSPENLGYFPGLNVGLCRIRREHPDILHVVVGNNDLVFPAKFLEQVRCCGDVFDRWAVVAPDLVTPEGVHQNPHVAHPIGRLRRAIWDLHYTWYGAAVCIGTAARLTRRFTSRRENLPDHELHEQPGPIEQGYGACYLLGPRFFERFQRLYAPTFLMQEEYFLTEQLRSVDQLTYYEPRIVVQHVGHATMGRVPNRPRWALAREAHRVYKRFERMSQAERRDAIEAFASAPWPDGCLPSAPPTP